MANTLEIPSQSDPFAEYEMPSVGTLDDYLNQVPSLGSPADSFFYPPTAPPVPWGDLRGAPNPAVMQDLIKLFRQQTGDPNNYIGEFGHTFTDELQGLGKGGPFGALAAMLQDSFGEIGRGEYGSGIGTLLLGPLGGILGGALQDVFTGVPHTQKTSETGKAFLGSDDPIIRFLGQDVLSGANRDRVLSESGGGGVPFESEVNQLADALELLGQHQIPGIRDNILNVGGHKEYGVRNLGQDFVTQLSPEQFQQKFGFGIPNQQELSAFLNSPFAPSTEDFAHGWGGGYRKTVEDYRKFLQAGGPGLPQALGAENPQANVGGVGTSINGLVDALSQMNAPNLQSMIAKAVQKATAGRQQPSQQQGPKLFQPPRPQDDPWHLAGVL